MAQRPRGSSSQNSSHCTWVEENASAATESNRYDCAVTSTPTPAALPNYRPHAKYVLMLGAIAAVPAISTDIYLPSLPTVAAELGASDSAVQLTMSGMLIGGAVGQLVYGPLTDRFGRKVPLLVGLALHVIISILCAFAPNVSVLIGLRVLQGFCNAAASIVAISVIRDRFTGAPAARLLSQLMLVIGVAPLFAPTIGGFIASIWDWRAVFIALAAFGAFMWIGVGKFLPETLPVERRITGGARGVARGYKTLFTDPKFLALALLPAVAMTTIMCYVVGSPFVFQEGFGLSKGEFSALFAVNGVALVLSSQVNAALVTRFAPSALLRTALLAQVAIAALLVVLARTEAGGFWAFAGCLWLLLMFQGLIAPNAQVLALNNYGHMVGTAAAVLGSLMAGVSGLVSPLVGVFGADAQAMSLVIFGSLCVGVLILIFGTDAFAKKPRQNRG